MSNRVRNIKFQIEGEIVFHNYEKNRNTEKEVLQTLMHQRNSIEQKIADELSRRFDTRVWCDLIFEEGSIIVSGTIMLE